MSAVLGTVSVEVKPDAEAIAKAVREGVAGVLRAIADEIEKTTPPPPVGTVYHEVPTIPGRYKDKDGDDWTFSAVDGWMVSWGDGFLRPDGYLPMTRTGDL